MAKKEKIDFSDIPEWTTADFRRARRVTPAEVEAGRRAIEAKLGVVRPRRGRPFLGALKARDIHLRIPPGILERLRTKAEKRGIGYQTLINQILSRAA
jgi:uncharacterized protein (DUF4415 family)